jgi:hypothetical protein
LLVIHSDRLVIDSILSRSRNHPNVAYVLLLRLHALFGSDVVSDILPSTALLRWPLF